VATEKKTADESVQAAKEVGADEVQAKFDEAGDKGYFGEVPEQASRESFTLRGVSSK
jgi:hypothetical protein